MTLNLSIRNYSLDIAGLDCTRALVSFSGADTKIDQGGLITFKGQLVLGVPKSSWTESLDDRRNSRWERGNTITLNVADTSDALRLPPRGGTTQIISSLYEPRTRKLTIHFADCLELSRFREPAGNASKICLGKSSSVKGVINALLEEAGLGSNAIAENIPGSMNAPAPRLLEGSYIDQAAAIAAAAGWFLYVESDGTIHAAEIITAQSAAIVTINGHAALTERVDGEIPPSELIVKGRASIVRRNKLTTSSVKEKPGPASLLNPEATGEIIVERVIQSDEYRPSEKKRITTEEVQRPVGLIFPDDESLQGNSQLITADYRKEEYQYEQHAPITGLSTADICEQGNQGRLKLKATEYWAPIGLGLKEVFASYPEDEPLPAPKTDQALTEKTETTYQYDSTSGLVRVTFRLEDAWDDDTELEQLGVGPRIVDRKWEMRGSILPDEYAFSDEGMLTSPEVLQESLYTEQEWHERNLGEWVEESQNYQSLVRQFSSLADTLRDNEDLELADLAEILLSLYPGERTRTISNSGGAQPPAADTHPAEYSITEKTFKGKARFPFATSSSYRQPKQELSFDYLTGTNRSALETQATKLAKLWATIKWGQYRCTAYTTDLADSWWDYKPLSRVDANESEARFSYLGDGFALAIAGNRCAVSIDGLYLGERQIVSAPGQPSSVVQPGQTVPVPGESIEIVSPPYLQSGSLEAAGGSAAKLSYRLYDATVPVVQAIQLASASAAKLLGTIDGFDLSAYDLLFNRFNGTYSSSRKTALNTFIRGLKTTEGLWDSIDAFYLFAGNTAADSLLNWKRNANNATQVGVPTFTADRGFTTSSGNYLNTNFNPAIHGVNYQLLAATLGIYTTTNNAANAVDIGSESSTSVIWSEISAKWSNGNVYCYINDEYGVFASMTSSAGWTAATRIDNSTTQIWKDGVSPVNISGVPATGIPNYSFFIGAANVAGVPLYPANRQYQAAVIAGEWTPEQHAAFYSLLHNYLSSFGAA